MSTIVIRNRIEELRRLNRAVQQFVGECDLPATEQSAIELVLEELVTNAINHGYREGGEHEIEISLRMDGDTIEIRLEDDGQPFDPTERGDPDTESTIADRAIGGLGIHLVKNFMHEVAYERRDGHNVLTLRRNPER